MTRIALALAALIASPAAAQTTTSPATSPAFVFTLRAGAASNPAYFGSDEYEVSPGFGFTFHYLRLPGGREFGDPHPRALSSGFDVHGSFNYVGGRDPADHPELAGMPVIDPAIEIGLGIGYTDTYFEGFADLRRGFGGHEGVVFELGGDAIFRPTDDLKVTLGPRMTIGSDRFMDTYFGVNAAQRNSTLHFYNPGGGIVSVGAELGVDYQFNDTWGFAGEITYTSFENLAVNSPIVSQDNEDFWGISFGVTRVFSIGG